MKQVNISEVRTNDNNPRVIKDYKFEKLKRSLKEFPKMLELRPIIVDENNVILGGNMRYRASVEAGLDKVWIKVADNLTEEEKQEFIIKDNSSFGEWDWEILANEWDTTKLKEWGLDIPKWEDTVDDFDDGIEDTGEYEFPDEGLEASHVKMVQLFLTTETEPDFKRWEMGLREKFGTDNVTDTVYQVIKKAYEEN